jgi:AmiR/NasT family two-component response regulator
VRKKNELFSKAIVLSTMTSSNAMLLREQLRIAGIEEIFMAKSLPETVLLINTHHADILVVDDSFATPAPYTLRQLLQFPETAIIPVLAFLSQSKSSREYDGSHHIGRPAIIRKPLTPEKFKLSFKTLKAQWSQNSYRKVKEAHSNLLKQNQVTALKSLIDFATDSEIHSLALPFITHFYIQSNNSKIAEKMLLAAIKTSPKDLGIILTLSDLYIKMSLPDNARKLLIKSRSIFGDTSAILPDLYQISLILEDYEGAVATLIEMKKMELLPDFVEPALTEILYSTGRINEISKHTHNRSLVKELEILWDTGKSQGNH